jgi:hypothetical protein
MINPAQYWWDHLTRKQQLFLLSHPMPTSYTKLEQEIEVWYQFALTNDLHSLPNFPETSIDDLRKI